MTNQPPWAKLLEKCGFRPSGGPELTFDNLGESIPGVESNYHFNGGLCTMEVIMHIADMEPEDLKELMMILCRNNARLGGKLHAMVQLGKGKIKMPEEDADG